MLRLTTLLGVLLLLAGCVQPYRGPPVARGPELATQDQTAGTEEQDRINRFQRLSDMEGIAAPAVQQVLLPPGSADFMSGPVPVVRVTSPSEHSLTSTARRRYLPPSRLSMLSRRI
jgi:hypothetical protein